VMKCVYCVLGYEYNLVHVSALESRVHLEAQLRDQISLSIKT